MAKIVSLITLGCKLNFSETSTLARKFQEAGYNVVYSLVVADLYIINTCSVTEHADKKGRNIIRRAHKLNPEARIVVVGCYAQLKPAEIMALDGVYAVLGADQKGAAFEIATSDSSQTCAYVSPIDSINGFFAAHSSGERTRSFLKVQDGCDYKCSYCTVPLARGHSRNIPVAGLVNQAKQIAAGGIKEIVLTGVNTGDFGKSTGESFLTLLQALN
ncbi:MAG: radical SAM protein, partial [Bacteroidales bacterium]|nr:radical SAM protein [Bacteroidales bacterium]